MPKREAQLKAAVMRELARRYPHYVVQLFASAGSPDRSITGDGRTTHWEFKHGTPHFKSPGIQELFCMRLAEQGHCRYVIWQEDSYSTNKRTLIATPRAVHERDSGIRIVAEAFCLGHDPHWVVDRIREAMSGAV